VVCSNAASAICSIISGIPYHPIEDVKLENILIQHQGGGAAENAWLQLPEKEKDYPEPTMFGTTPSHGFFVRHVRGLEMNGIKIISQEPDARPAFVLDDVRGADFFQIKAAHPRTPGVPVFSLKNVQDFSVFRSKPVADTEIESVQKQEL
jgi:hypothetical protein